MKKNKRGLQILFLFLLIISLFIGCDNNFETTQEYVLKVNQPEEGGEINLDPSKDKYEEGTEVEIAAIADPDWSFTKWTGGLEGTDKKVYITIERDLIIEAEFDKEDNNEEENDTEDSEYTTVEGHISLTNRIPDSNDDSGPPFSSVNTANINNNLTYVENEVIVKFEGSANQQEILDDLNLKEKRPGAFGTVLLKDEQNRDIKILKNNLDKNPQVEYAELNYIFNIDIEPSEPQNAEDYNQQEDHYSLISLPYTWSNTSESSDMTVAIMDTGIDDKHPDLENNIVPGKNFTDEGNSDDTSDKNGHGTHVAGTVGATDNEKVVGVSWKVGLMPVKVLDEEGSGTLANIAEGIEWIIEEKNADIINLSLGSSASTNTLKSAVENAHNAGIILIASAGNEGEDEVFYPAAYEEVIAVGSVDYDMEKSSFSNYGDKLDFMAPGEKIYSTIPDGNYENLYGTSMAAPHVSGVVALMLAQSEIEPDHIKTFLKKSAQDLGENKGKDYEYGYGLINSHAAINIERENGIKIFVGRKDEEESKIYVKSDFTTPDTEGFYDLDISSDNNDEELYIYSWFDVTDNNKISSGDYFGKSSDPFEEKTEYNFKLELITAEDDFETIEIIY